MLSSMFSGHFDMEPDEDGCYFIDRNPDFFPIILDYLRKVYTFNLVLALCPASPLCRSFPIDLFAWNNSLRGNRRITNG